MKVLHISNYFYPAIEWGGPVYSLYALCKNLQQHCGADVEVLTTNALSPLHRAKVTTASFPEKLEGRFDVYYCNRTIGKFGSPHLMRMAYRLIPDADIVHITGNYTPNIFNAIFYCWLQKKPTFWSPRGSILATRDFKDIRFGQLKASLDWLFSRFLGQHIVVHCTSEDEREQMNQKYPNIKTCLITNGVDLADTSPANFDDAKSDGKFRLLFLSRLDPKKAIENLIQSINLLPEKFIVDICGDGPPKYKNRLERLVDELGLRDRVQFLGHIDGEHKESVFANAKIFVLPSHSENFGNVVAEALARELPVIVSKNTPWSDVEKHQCGLWVENDPASVAKAILKLENADLKLMGSRGREWMEKDFSWKSKSFELFDEYQMLLNTNS